MPRGGHTNSQKALILANVLRQIEKCYFSKRHRRRASNRAKDFLSQYTSYHRGISNDVFQKVQKSMLQSGGMRKRKTITNVHIEIREKFLHEEKNLEKEIAELQKLMNELTRMRRLTRDVPNQNIVFHLQEIESEMKLPFMEVLLPEAKRQLKNVMQGATPLVKSMAHTTWDLAKPVAQTSWNVSKPIATSLAKKTLDVAKFGWNTYSSMMANLASRYNKPTVIQTPPRLLIHAPFDTFNPSSSSSIPLTPSPLMLTAPLSAVPVPSPVPVPVTIPVQVESSSSSTTTSMPKPPPKTSLPDPSRVNFRPRS